MENTNTCNNECNDCGRSVDITDTEVQGKKWRIITSVSTQYLVATQNWDFNKGMSDAMKKMEKGEVLGILDLARKDITNPEVVEVILTKKKKTKVVKAIVMDEKDFEKLKPHESEYLYRKIEHL